MAKVKKDKKSKGSRKSYLNKIAGRTGRDFGQYMKYGDIPEHLVHEGTANLLEYAFTDSPGTAKSAYGRAVKTGHGKDYFILQNKLYKVTNSTGTTSEQVKV